jgi:polyhydroxyalkanoate synthesis regulator phasin
MKSTQRIAKYMVEFNRLSTITGWDSRALRHQFYRGLPARIKDEVSHVGKPDTLRELRILAQSIDSRYWEREEETKRERPSQSSEKKPEKSPNQASSSSNSNNSNKHGKKPHPPRDSASSSQNTEKKTSDLGDKLGKDGKLTTAERARRFANNLCLFCGGTGHTAKECPKSSSSSSKAKLRAAKSKPDSKTDSNPAEDSKK